MQNKLLYSLIFHLFTSVILFGQNDYYIKSKGSIPSEFRTPSTIKYQTKIASLNKDASKKTNTRKEQKNTEQFYLESSFSIDDLLQSGYILFNDQASNYLNEVIKQLPFSAKVKKSNPRVFLLNSNVANAFATEQGIIFVSVGLLANLQTEAQLAFILAHELAHVEHKHSLDKFLKTKDINAKSYQKNVSKISLDRELFSEAMYSQKLEKEADKEGLELFLQSKYSPQSIKDVFKILHYSYLPYMSKVFEKSFFEDEDYLLPSFSWDIQLPDIRKISDNEKEKKASTHPSALERLKFINDNISDSIDSRKSDYILGEQKFKEIRDLMRFQMPQLALENGNFARALYNAYLLSDSYPENKELKKVIAKSLYYESKFSRVYDNENTLSEDSIYQNVEYLDFEGEAQRVGAMFTFLSPQELNILALKYAFELQVIYPEDEDIKWIVEDLFIELCNDFSDLSSFKSDGLANSNTVPETKDTSTISFDEMSKSEKIKAINSEDEYWQYAFVDYIENENFTNTFDEAQRIYNYRKNRLEKYDTDEYIREERKIKKKNFKIGKSLGIKKVVVVNPFYLDIDERKENNIQYIKSEKGHDIFLKSIDQAAEKSKLEVEILDIAKLNSSDVEEFNNITQLSKYVNQQFLFDDLSLTAGIQQEEVNKIADKYNTDYFLYTGVIAVTQDEQNILQKLAYGIMLYPTLPYVIYDILKPDNIMLHYAIIFNVKNGSREILSMNYFNIKDSKYLIKAHTYDVFNQISKE